MNSAIAARTSDGLPLPQRYWAIVVIILGVSLAVLDSVIANVALPTIGHALNVTPSTSIWVVNAYQLAVVMALLPLSAAGDLFGYKRVYLSGLALFTVASIGCTFADSMATLTFARVWQGLGAAGVMSVNTALIRNIYPAHRLGRGVSLNSAVVAMATAIGPSVTAGVLAVASWPYLFAVNVPIGVLAIGIGLKALPRARRQPGNYDFPSALLNALTFGLLIVSLNGISHAENPELVCAGLVLTVIVGYVFVKRQLARPSPLLPVDLLKRPIFALSIATSLFMFAGQMLAFVSLPFYLQDVLGRSQVETGLLMTPWPLIIVVVAPLAGLLADRYSAGVLSSIGAAVMALGLFLLATLPSHPDAFEIMWRMAVCGAGFGFFQSPNNKTIMMSAPHDRSGGASGMLSTTRLTGQAFGATLVALFFARWPAHGNTLALLAATLFCAAAAVFSVLRLRGGAARPIPAAPNGRLG